MDVSKADPIQRPWVRLLKRSLDVPTRTPGWAEELIEAGGANGRGTWTVQIPVGFSSYGPTVGGTEQFYVFIKRTF
jgi:hypothetical protein